MTSAGTPGDVAPGCVLAGGTVPWRTGAGGEVQVALVHRPKYDDWSLPKGKCEAGEHPAVAAVRETVEETGYSGPLGRPLGQTSYLTSSPAGPQPKVVHYFAMAALGGVFTPSAEVDRLEWLPVPRALDRLSRAEDCRVLDRFTAAPPATITVLLIRHGRAGDRKDWTGPDAERPLDAEGRRQAADLAAVAPAFGISSIHAADVLRCVQTVSPLAAALGLTVEHRPGLSERCNLAGPAAALRVLGEVLAAGRHAAVCSQGGVIPDVLVTLAERDGVELPSVRARKGSVWVLSFADGALVSADYLPRLSAAG